MAWKLGISTKSGTEAAIDVCDYFTNEESCGSVSGLSTNQDNQYTQLRKSVMNGDVRSVESIIKSQNDNKWNIDMAAEEGSNLLFLACQLGHKKIVELLFKAGADGMTASCSCLISAINGGHIEVVQCILNSVPELIQHSTLEHWTPLHAACINGHIDIVKLLLFYEYPDHILKSYRRDFDDDSWECRLAFDPNTQDVTGQTSMYVSCLLGNISLISTLLSWKVRYVRTSTIGTDDEEEKFHCPFLLNKLCGAPRETALLASVRGGYTGVVKLLLQNGADPNTYSKPVDDQSIIELSNSPIAEAARQKFYEIIEILLENGASDSSNTALSIAVANNDDYILGRLLSVSCYADPEFKINKKKMLNAFESNIGRKSDSNVTYSNLYPVNGVIVNWHFSNCQLPYIKEQWLTAAAKHCNPNLMVTASMKSNVLGAITRIDLSHNSLTTIPSEIFYLCSLRYLNLSQNKLETLPQESATFDCPFLEEIYLQNNKLDEIPARYFLFPELKTLDVSNNKIQKLPKEMWKALNLRDLNVAFNLLRSFPLNIYSRIEFVNLFQDQQPESPMEIQRTKSFNDSEPVVNSKRQKLMKLDMKHLPIWIDNLEITENDLSFSSLDCGQLQLTNLNIANNLFTSIPASLPCLAPNLTRLNISYNSLRTMGYVTSYPASLRQLDLSHNEITCWPSLPRLTSSDPHLMCYNIDCSRSECSCNLSLSRTEHVEDVSRSLRNVVLKSVCQHRKHLRLESLRTLILSDNSLSRIQLTTDDIELTDTEENDWNIVGTSKVRLMFPNLSMLDISNNCLKVGQIGDVVTVTSIACCKFKEIPSNLYELSNLSVLNISGNIDITDLPANMGLLSRLWNLNTKGCSIQGPLHSMIESGKYKTMDIIGYLKSIFEDAKAYARMKLMVVGVQGIGKTSLLELLRQESTVKNKKGADHWTRRMGNSTSKSEKYSNISTVGVDISDWVCEKKVKGTSQHGPVVFRTWDFGGQKEYYTTHQYFLSKRSLYLVVWRISDGKQGLTAILQWLSNIQARAPNSPVIIVGTHYDEIGVSISVEEAQQLQQTIRERFIVVMDSEKLGLPKVLDSIEVSCKTKYNIPVLANLIYDAAFSLRLPGSKELMLYQKVPSTYLALEDVISNICYQFKSSGTDPVLNFEGYKHLVTQEMLYNNYKTFRDTEELHQATMFLHDNGVILHYDDATLRDLYFLDPQWLCDVLAHVVTIREINPFARNGLMKIDDLQHIFKSSSAIAKNQYSYIVTLLNKFEVALSWDSRTLLIPSLLPDAEKSANEVVIKVSQKSFQQSKSYSSENDLLSYSISFERQDKSITRLLLMSYFPSGFWSRLITRILADDQIVNAIGKIYTTPRNSDQIFKISDMKWQLWQCGIALYLQDNLIFRLHEVSMQCEHSIFRQPNINFALKHDDNWSPIAISKSCLMEIFFPMNVLCVSASDDSGKSVRTTKHEISVQNLTQILSICVDHIDILLEDWYPTLGTRFVHTSEGRFLVTRLIPCPKCFSIVSSGKPQTPDQVSLNESLCLLRKLRPRLRPCQPEQW
ncbi:hypothetical protein HA402_006078 [Bradysia odoriphaga]|nr:hypothetical protein HA402_006078 [Bradysia odoriphaga]